jgi:hypothetical protein
MKSSSGRSKNGTVGEVTRSDLLKSRARHVEEEAKRKQFHALPWFFRAIEINSPFAEFRMSVQQSGQLIFQLNLSI